MIKKMSNQSIHQTSMKIGSIKLGPIPNKVINNDSTNMNEFVELELRLAKANEEIHKLKEIVKKQKEKLLKYDISIEDKNIAEQYIILRDTVLEIRKENHKKTENFSRSGQSGFYYTPQDVIDLNREFMLMSCDVASRFSEKFKK